MSDEKTMTMEELKAGIRKEVEDELDELIENPHPEDQLFEMADSATPVYTGDILDVFRSDTSLWGAEPEIDTQDMTAIAFISAVIYDELFQTAQRRLKELKIEREEAEELDEDE